MSNPSFTNLVSITLNYYKSQELPPFGGLPCLKCLNIHDVDGVEHISHDFNGRGMVKIGFPSLQKLHIFHLDDLETGLVSITATSQSYSNFLSYAARSWKIFQSWSLLIHLWRYIFSSAQKFNLCQRKDCLKLSPFVLNWRKGLSKGKQSWLAKGSSYCSGSDWSFKEILILYQVQCSYVVFSFPQVLWFFCVN